MRDAHLTAEDLKTLEAGEPTMALADHLFACTSCWRQACEVLARVDLGKLSQSLRESLITREPRRSALLERYRLEQDRLEGDLAAQEGVAKVRSRKRKQRKEYVARTKRYHTRHSVLGMLAEARAANAPYEGEEWADLALVGCYQIIELPEAEKADLLGECYSEIAGARRRSARWQLAREAVKQGREHHAKGTGSRLVEGHLLMVEGCIEGDLGFLEKAESLLTSAAESFLLAGTPKWAAKATIQIAYVVLDVSPERTVDFLGRAESLIPQAERRLAMFAESIRVDALITLGFTREAMRRFAFLTELYDQFGDPFIQLRRRFTAGRLLEAVGRFEEADILFNDVIAADLDQRSNKSFFLDLVYLLDSYIRRGDILGAMGACEKALDAITVLDIDDVAQKQMRDVWAGLRERIQAGGGANLKIILKARRFIKTQWRTVGGDALLIKESAV